MASNAICNSSGATVGFRCSVCYEIRDRMWGEVCNLCRERREQNNALVAALFAAKEQSQ